MTCIGEPISWPRLERFALGPADPAIAAHLAACPACRHCLDLLRADVVDLPPLVIAGGARNPARGLRRRWIAPVFAAAAAAVVLIVVLRPTPEPAPEVDGFARAISIKGVGEVTLELVRERAGAIRFDARSYAPGDRWKVMVTCPPRAMAVTIDVSIADGVTTDHPLAQPELACGNRVVVPGAFTITGARSNRVCATVAAGPGAEAGTACATLRPE